MFGIMKVAPEDGTSYVLCSTGDNVHRLDKFHERLSIHLPKCNGESRQCCFVRSRLHVDVSFGSVQGALVVIKRGFQVGPQSPCKAMMVCIEFHWVV